MSNLFNIPQIMIKQRQNGADVVVGRIAERASAQLFVQYWDLLPTWQDNLATETTFYKPGPTEYADLEHDPTWPQHTYYVAVAKNLALVNFVYDARVWTWNPTHDELAEARAAVTRDGYDLAKVRLWQISANFKTLSVYNPSDAAPRGLKVVNDTPAPGAAHWVELWLCNTVDLGAGQRLVARPGAPGLPSPYTGRATVMTALT